MDNCCSGQRDQSHQTTEKAILYILPAGPVRSVHPWGGASYFTGWLETLPVAWRGLVTSQKFCTGRRGVSVVTSITGSGYYCQQENQLYQLLCRFIKFLVLAPVRCWLPSLLDCPPSLTFYPASDQCQLTPRAWDCKRSFPLKIITRLLAFKAQPMGKNIC